MFKQSLNLISEIKLLHLHVFPYSAREGTPAAKMPQVPTAIRKERASILRAAGKKELRQYIESRIGTTEQVLIEKESLGRTEHFIPMTVNDSTTPGEIVRAIVQTVSTNKLCGVIKLEGPH
jgi:threonylcarbamoyladenosine tRNA methylthiotransferase MtaB